MRIEKPTDKMRKRSIINRLSEAHFLFFLFFLLSFIYFFWFSDYVLFFQEQQSIFLFSGEFLHEHLIEPGGILVLAGKFLTQFYSIKILGSIILAGIITLPGIILLNIVKKLIPGKPFPLFLLIIPSCLLGLMQSHYYHEMEYNLGYLLVLLWLHISITAKKSHNRYPILALFPLFYYISGAYSWIYMLIYVLYLLFFEKGSKRLQHIGILLIIGLSAFLIFTKYLFILPVKQLLFYPLPSVNDTTHKILFIILTSYVVLFLLPVKIFSISTTEVFNRKYINFISGLAAVLAAAGIIITGYNPQTGRVINLEELVFNEKWNEVIRYQEKYPSENMIGQYFYNIALSETDQLCDRLFFGRQDFGTASLILPWSDDHLTWGAYFHYSIGLVNEAHRWAYEEMVVYGYRPQNLKLLVKTNLINGHYIMAEKYTGILKKTIFYRRWAKEYEKLAGDSLAVRADAELGKKISILPMNDFFTFLEEPQNNLPLLLEANPKNKKAFEYITAWLLLTKNVEPIVANIGKLKELSYTHIPRHIEEALLIHYSSTKMMPDLGGLMISPQTLTRFEQYTAAYKALHQTPALNKETMQKRFGNTFWFYYQFK